MWIKTTTPGLLQNHDRRELLNKKERKKGNASSRLRRLCGPNSQCLSITKPVPFSKKIQFFVSSLQKVLYCEEIIFFLLIKEHASLCLQSIVSHALTKTHSHTPEGMAGDGSVNIYRKKTLQVEEYVKCALHICDTVFMCNVAQVCAHIRSLCLLVFGP